MAMASVQDILEMKQKLIQTSLDLAADSGWSNISMDDIIIAADVDMAAAKALFDDKDMLLAAYARDLDLRLEAAFSKANDDCTRDRLFDIVMERFDMLNDNRAGVISILNSLTLDPGYAAQSLPLLCRSTSAMLALAGYQVEGWKSYFKISAFTGLYFKILRDWIKDDSADMAPTMASLDRALGLFEKLDNM